MVVHAALIGALLWPHARPKAVVEDAPPDNPVVKFIENHGKPGKQPARSDASSVHPDRDRVKPPSPRKATPPPKEMPVERAPEVTSAAVAVASEPDEPIEGVVEIGNNVGGPGDSTSPGTGGPGFGTRTGPIAFEGQSMTPPQRLSGPDPRYTQQALEHEVEGVMEVRCIVGLDGKVSDCHAVRSLPFMDREVIEALLRRRYLPATQGGRAIAVEYVFHIELRLP
jgi:protein TonB